MYGTDIIGYQKSHIQIHWTRLFDKVYRTVEIISLLITIYSKSADQMIVTFACL